MRAASRKSLEPDRRSADADDDEREQRDTRFFRATPHERFIERPFASLFKGAISGFLRFAKRYRICFRIFGAAQSFFEATHANMFRVPPYTLTWTESVGRRWVQCPVMYCAMTIGAEDAHSHRCPRT